MMFLNAHPALFGVKRLIPSVIDIIGGLHIQPPKPLPLVNDVTQLHKFTRKNSEVRKNTATFEIQNQRSAEVPDQDSINR